MRFMGVKLGLVWAVVLVVVCYCESSAQSLNAASAVDDGSSWVTMRRTLPGGPSGCRWAAFRRRCLDPGRGATTNGYPGRDRTAVCRS